MKNIITGRRSTSAQESDPFAQYWARTASDPVEQDWAATTTTSRAGVESSVGTNLQYTWAIDPAPEDESRGNRGVVNMVKKLNCGANRERSSSKVQQIEEDQLTAPRQPRELIEEDQSDLSMGGKWQRLRTSCTSREMDFATMGACRVASVPPIENTRFVSDLGAMSRTSSRTKAIQRQYRREPLKSSTPVESRGVLGNKKQQQQQPMSVRPKRLGKGFQLQNVVRRGSDQHTTSSGEDSGSNQTGGSTVSYSDTDYTTTDNSSDDSVVRYDRKSGGQVRANGRSLSRSASRKGKSSKSRGTQDSPLDSLWTAVAQDLGILAGFVLADGKACVGSVSELAQETMGEACTSNGLRPASPGPVIR